MRSSIIVLSIVSALVAVTGCSASSQRVHSSSGASDTSSDPAYNPPGQMNIAISDGPARAAAPKPKTAAAATEAMPQPNKNAIQKHSIRAAASMY